MHTPKTTRAQRLVSGAVAGLFGTIVMDITGTVFWERAMHPEVQRKEREIEPRYPLVVLSERIAKRLRLQTPERATMQISTALHWGIGLACGALHGLVENRVPAERRSFALPIVLGMLTVDEFVFPAAGLCPWPRAFPWQTHARGVTAHLAYGVAMAVCYEGCKNYLASSP